METRLLRLPEVMRVVGLRRSAIYARVAQGTFPRPISIGARAVAWSSDAISAWVADRIAQSGEGV